MVNFLRNHGARTKIVNYAVAIIVAIALSQDNAIFRGRVRWFSPVEGFQTKSTRTRSRVIPSVTENAGSRDANTVPSSLALTSTSNTILFMAQGNNKMKNSKKNDDETTASPVFWKDLQKKPASHRIFCVWDNSELRALVVEDGTFKNENGVTDSLTLPRNFEATVLESFVGVPYRKMSQELNC